jgi:predicted nuclease of predicted toxin-antitoxin system
LDEGLPRRAAQDLRDLGLDCIHVTEAGLRGHPDHFVLLRAGEEGRVLVTLDADFSRLLAISQWNGPSILHLRMEGLDRARTVEILRHIPKEVLIDLGHGAIVSASQAGFRIRRLPLPDPFE